MCQLNWNIFQIFARIWLQNLTPDIKTSRGIYMELFRPFLLICVNGFCLGFVIFQIIECIETYNEKPIGTRMSIEKSADIIFPTFTICPKFGTNSHYNQSHLEGICGIRYYKHFYFLNCTKAFILIL